MRKPLPPRVKDLEGSVLRRDHSLLPVTLALAFLVHFSVSAELWINEILFNPPGADTPNEYIELRGTPNLLLPAGTYLVAVEGNSGANPGTLQNVFDLSGQRVGGNGLLVLMQNGSPYAPDTSSTVLQNTGGPGWGSGSNSSIGHRGRNGLTELSNPSVTFFLLQSTSAPNPGDDIDLDNDGIPDGLEFGSWAVLDSVGVLDADGAGDIAYGAINFRRDAPPGNAAAATGTVVPVGFTARYIGRSGNTTGSGSGDWVASDALAGAAPAWVLGPPGSTYPQAFAGVSLVDLGAVNFGAPPIPGILETQTDSLKTLLEGGAPGSYNLRLTVPPNGEVSVQLSCSSRLQVSLDGGASYGPQAVLRLGSTLPATIMVRALADDVLDASPQSMAVSHTIVATSEPYPLGSIIPEVNVSVREGSPLVFSEAKVNPPGTNDSGSEFIELKGFPGTVLSNVLVLAVDGNANGDPGNVTYSLRLDGVALGANGLLLVAPTNSPYSASPGTTVVEDLQLNQPGGALGNGALSLFVLTTRSAVRIGDDLDKGNNGVLEGLPPDTTIHDSIGWSNGGKDDRVYAGATLVLGSAAPDAAVRFPGRYLPNDPSAWFFGELLGPDPLSLTFDPELVSGNFPSWTILTPGDANNTAPRLTTPTPVSGVIGDASNPPLLFHADDTESGPGLLSVTADSSNPGVVPSTNLFLTSTSPGDWQLALSPVGVGYSDITLSASDGSMTGRVTVPYAASAPGRSNTVWHIGASDGSTAIPTEGDHVLLGDDENQILRVYPRSSSGLPLQQFDMTPFLGLPDINSGLPREVDIEASTRVGNRLYWMGSHGHGAEGEPRTNRTRVFATDLVGNSLPTLKYVGRYDYLKTDLIAWDSLNLHGKGTNYYGLEASDADNVPPKAPDGSGLSIEGLSAVPGNPTAAYIGFRAPIVPANDRNFALVVPILNFTDVVDNSRPPGSCVFGSPIEFDLYGRGIRSIEGSTNGFIIIGGPAAASTGPYPADFRLYTWTGVEADAPWHRTADLAGLNPEGIVGLPSGPWTPDTVVELLSDNGATVFYGDGIPAKRLKVQNFKKCRSDAVQLGQAVKPAPLITSVSSQNGTLRLRWRSLKGELYAVEAQRAAEPGIWRDVGNFPAPGPYTDAVVEITAGWEFFRIRLANRPFGAGPGKY